VKSPKPALLLALLAGLLAGCEDDGAEGPTAPRGTWSGVYSQASLSYGLVDGARVSDRPSAQQSCLVSLLFAQPWPYRVELRQSGDQIEGTLRDVQLGLRCKVRGTVDGDGSLRWAQTDCSPRCVDVTVSGRCDLEVCAVRQTAHGLDNVPAVDANLEWDVTDRATGETRRIAMAAVLGLDR
jgi:hypothetical protein